MPFQRLFLMMSFYNLNWKINCIMLQSQLFQYEKYPTNQPTNQIDKMTKCVINSNCSPTYSAHWFHRWSLSLSNQILTRIKFVKVKFFEQKKLVESGFRNFSLPRSDLRSIQMLIFFRFLSAPKSIIA